MYIKVRKFIWNAYQVQSIFKLKETTIQKQEVVNFFSNIRLYQRFITVILYYFIDNLFISELNIEYKYEKGGTY